MIRLCDLKCYSAIPLEGAFATAHLLDVEDLAKHKGPALVIAADVAPDLAAEAYVLENDLVNCGKAILVPTISAVTGTFLKRGVTFVPKGQALDTMAELVLPLSAGRFAGNATPQLAFQTAHAIWQNTAPPDSVEQNLTALALSLGSDAPNGEWWLAGALTGFLRLPSEPELTALLEDPTDLLPSLRALAARVRLGTGVPVCTLDRHQSAVMKSMLTNIAPSEYWQVFAAACDDLGFGKTAARYKAAAVRIWG